MRRDRHRTIARPVTNGADRATITRMGWAELGQAVLARRVELGYRTRPRFAKLAELSVKTLGEIERGDRGSYDPATLAHLEQVLGWPDGRMRELVGDDMPGPKATPPRRRARPELQEVEAEEEPRTIFHPDEIARTIRRDDFVLVWMLTNAALTPADLLRVEMLIRQRREQWEREHLWPAVAARIAELGGVVSWPWDDGAGQ